MKLGDQIRTARQAKGWSRQQLADAIGVTMQSVCNWENGTGGGGPSVKRWPAIQSALGIKLSAGRSIVASEQELKSVRASPEALRLARMISKMGGREREAIETIIRSMMR